MTAGPTGRADSSGIVARAPGRVNLIGEHTDYNEGLALPIAIDRYTSVHFVPDGSPSLMLTTSLYGEPARIGVVPPPTEAEARALAPAWARLPAALVAVGKVERGGRAAVASTVPQGSGLSSSAALCVALSMALGIATDELGTARLCQRAEAVVGAGVGLMDPLASSAARKGNALLVDFASNSWSYVPIPSGVDIIVVQSGEVRSLASTGYSVRRAECKDVERSLGKPLGRAESNDVRAIRDPVLRRRARHVVTECERVRQMTRALLAGDLITAGETMTASHRSQKEDFEVSTPRIDELVDSLMARPGMLGARLTGGGFGGSVVAAAERGAVNPQDLPGPAMLVMASDGATRLRRRLP